jgi:hypothetical protein
MIDQEPIEPDEQTMVIRPAEPADEAALGQLATLDGRRLGAAPLLVAECVGDGEIVAALSLADGTVVGDPFRYTLEAVAQLRRRADQLACGTTRRVCARRLLGRLSARQAAIAGSVLAAVLIGAAAGQAAPKTALPAGTWVGTGTANGTSTESGVSSKFTARLRFTIVVGSDGKVRGTGSFASHMTVSGQMSSEVASTAAVVFRGTSTDIAYSGTASTRARFATVIRTLKPITIRQRLPISRAGSCKASGGFVLNGLAFRWSAARKIDGTCLT